MMEEQNTLLAVVKDKKLFLYGFMVGLLAVWIIGGMQGENTGWLFVIGIAAFIIWTRQKKKEGKSVIDVIEDIANEVKPSGVYLDTDPKKVKVRWRGNDLYYFDFQSHGLTFTYQGKIKGGIKEITERSADSMKTELDNMYLDTGKTIEDIIND